MSDSNFDGVLDPASGWPDIPQASTQFVVLGGHGGPLNEQASTLAARTKKLKADIENFSGGGFGGQYKNLVVTVSGVGYQGTITADRLIIESGDFKAKVLRNINVAFNGANNGANGLDTGSIVAGNWYYLHVIYNPTSDTTASLISLNASSPALPSGYTMWCLVGHAYVPTAATAFKGMTKADDVTDYHVGGVANYVAVLVGGAASSTTAVSLATAIPIGATSVGVRLQQSISGAAQFFTTTTASSYVSAVNAGYSFLNDIVLVVSRTLYYSVSDGYAYITVCRFKTPY